MRVRVLGIGMGPGQVTGEVAAALAEADYVVAARKRDADPLLDVRRELCADYGLDLVAVPDPPRDREPDDYPGAVADWHEARVAAYAAVLSERGGTAAFLVWGDPSLYDSTIRIVRRLAELLPLEWDVLPGISAPQLLAARHRIVLHEVGEPVHVTTGRQLRRAVESGQRNLVVMLNAGLDLDGLDDWRIWWGANLGAAGEELVAGRVGDVRDELLAARERARTTAGWLMDVYLLRGN